MDSLDIDYQAMEHAYTTAQPEPLRYEISTREYNWTVNTWNAFTERYSDCNVWNRNGIIRFEGTNEQLNALLDNLYSDESNGKVIGVHKGWSEDKEEIVKVSYRVEIIREHVGLVNFAYIKPFDNKPTRQDVLDWINVRFDWFDETIHRFTYSPV